MQLDRHASSSGDFSSSKKKTGSKSKSLKSPVSPYEESEYKTFDMRGRLMSVLKDATETKFVEGDGDDELSGLTSEEEIQRKTKPKSPRRPEASSPRATLQAPPVRSDSKKKPKERESGKDARKDVSKDSGRESGKESPKEFGGREPGKGTVKRGLIAKIESGELTITERALRALVRVQALVRRFLTVRLLSKKSQDRKMIAREIVETEDFYVNKLRTIILFYERPLREALRSSEPILKEGQIDLLFSEISNILACHEGSTKSSFQIFFFFNLTFSEIQHFWRS